MQFVKDDHSMGQEEFLAAVFGPDSFNDFPKLENDAKFIFKDGALKLQYAHYNPIFIDIDAEVERHKIHFYKKSPYNELLAKAIGLKKDKPNPEVCDATGGMLSDSIMFIALGIESLSVYERNPILSLLIADALRRSKVSFNFQPISSVENRSFDVIYFDPMYDDKNVKTAPKKEMSILRDLVGPDLDCVEQAKKLRNLACKRLVIKRPIKARTILEAPSHQIKGKSTRYDVYMIV